MVFGKSYDNEEDIKVYQTEKVPGFVRLYDTDDEIEHIYRYKNDKLQDGISRFIFSNISSYGTQIFAKSANNDEEDRQYRFYKYADGTIEYTEQIMVLGQDEDYRTQTNYRFNPHKLEWEKVW